MDRRIKFRHLDAFSASARAGSLKAAAESLGLTQPAISRTLKELEEITGATLLERGRAGVQLTPEGEIFLQFAEASSGALRQGLQSLAGTRGAVGHVRVGALPSVAGGLLPRSLSLFAESNPDALVEVDEGPHEALTGRLRAGQLDLVVGRLGRPDSMAGLNFQQLYTEEVVVVARPDSAACRARRFDDLAAFRVLYPPKRSAIRPLVARLLIAQGVPLFPNRIETASSSFGRAMVLGDAGAVWFISRGVVATDLAEGRLVTLDVDSSATTGAVGVMTRAEDVPSPAARAFARCVVRAAA